MKKTLFSLLFLGVLAPATLETKPTNTTKKFLSTQEVESAFIDHFKKADFKQIAAVPVVQKNGEFITSGMAPLKEILLGRTQFNGELFFVCNLVFMHTALKMMR